MQSFMQDVSQIASKLQIAAKNKETYLVEVAAKVPDDQEELSVKDVSGRTVFEVFILLKEFFP